MSVNKFIEQNNKKFDNASAKDKRRMIARDVIAQLSMDNYIPKSVYFRKADVFDDTKCKVCGIGACLVSLDKLKSNRQKPDLLNIGLMVRMDSFWCDLKDLFGEDQLSIIEEFYENSNSPCSSFYLGIGIKYKLFADDLGEDEVSKINAAKKYFKGLGNKKRLTRIMENIVRNGEFDYEEEIRFRSQPPITTPITDDLIQSFRNTENQSAQKTQISYNNDTPPNKSQQDL